MYQEISFYCPEPISENGILVSCGKEGDTPETVIEIKKHNTTHQFLCPKGKTL